MHKIYLFACILKLGMLLIVAGPIEQGTKENLAAFKPKCPLLAEQLLEKLDSKCTKFRNVDLPQKLNDNLNDLILCHVFLSSLDESCNILTSDEAQRILLNDLKLRDALTLSPEAVCKQLLIISTNNNLKNLITSEVICRKLCYDKRVGADYETDSRCSSAYYLNGLFHKSTAEQEPKDKTKPELSSAAIPRPVQNIGSVTLVKPTAVPDNSQHQNNHADTAERIEPKPFPDSQNTVNSKDNVKSLVDLAEGSSEALKLPSKSKDETSVQNGTMQSKSDSSVKHSSSKGTTVTNANEAVDDTIDVDGNEKYISNDNIKPAEIESKPSDPEPSSKDEQLAESEPLENTRENEPESGNPIKSKDADTQANKEISQEPSGGDDSDVFEEPEAEEDIGKTVLSQKPSRTDFGAVNYTNIDNESNFFFYFMMLCIVTVLVYVAYHNKQKIQALMVEGPRQRHSRGRRPNSANYHKLDSNLEEAISSSCTKNTSNVIY